MNHSQAEPAAMRTTVHVMADLGIDEADVRRHVIRPDHIRQASARAEQLLALATEDRPPSGLLYRFDTAGFGDAMHALLSGCLVGYSMQLRRHGRLLLSQQWRWSKTHDDGAVAWDAGVPMHVASISKLITAMAMTRLLEERHIALDSLVIGWLPEYWQKGPGIGLVTFRHLLTHTSGLNFVPDPTPSDFTFMKEQVGIGTAHVGQRRYQNMNFGLCRILLATIDGTIPVGTTASLFGIDVSDNFWDVCSIAAYRRYVSGAVFAPAGVSQQTLDHPAPDALAYPFPAAGSGWDSGDLGTMAGGAGWHLSVDDLLAVMATFRRRGGIVGTATAQRMLDDGIGVDVVRDTPLGRVYAKGGFWSDGGGRTEQCNAFFLPKGMELVVLANSPFCAAGQGFMGAVSDAIDSHIENLLVSLATSMTAPLRALLRWFRRGA